MNLVPASICNWRFWLRLDRLQRCDLIPMRLLFGFQIFVHFFQVVVESRRIRFPRGPNFFHNFVFQIHSSSPISSSGVQIVGNSNPCRRTTQAGHSLDLGISNMPTVPCQQVLAGIRSRNRNIQYAFRQCSSIIRNRPFWDFGRGQRHHRADGAIIRPVICF